MASVKKLSNQRGGQEMAVMVSIDGKILIATIQVNFVLIPGEARMRQHKLIWIVAIKIFPSTYTIAAILGRPFWFDNFFHTGHFKQGRTLFLQPGCF